MSSTIQPNYSTSQYRTCTEARKTAQCTLQSSRFLDMAMQTGRRTADTFSAAAGGTADRATALPVNWMADLALRPAGQVSADQVEAAEAPSLESMLKAKYPNLVYHVFDASSEYWRSRNDYPHYLLYQAGDKAKETLESWQPVGANPFYGSIDGRFTAPKEIHALGKVPPGSKAVVIHPNVQARMEQDPAYTQEILERIDTWFIFDKARNEAMMPGSTAEMSQAVAIGADGSICNACSSSGGRLTFSQSGDEMVQAYYLRMAKRADFLHWLTQQQLRDHFQADNWMVAASAKSQLAELMSGGRLEKIFGSEIADVSTETVLALTRAQVWGNEL